MKKHTIYTAAVMLSLLFILQSCYVTRDYKRPEPGIEAYYRTDQLPDDSTTLAAVPWRELFTDPLLVSYIDKGLENNIDIRIALQQLETANAYYKQGRAGYHPVLGVTLQGMNQQLGNNSQMGQIYSGSINQFELSANASWEADIWGKIKSSERAAHAAYLQTSAAHKAVKTRLIANIASAYYQLLALDEQQRITEQSIANRKASLETTRALKEAGYVTEVGVQQTEAQVYAAQALLVDTKKNIKLLENTLSILLGDSPHEIERSRLSQQVISQKIAAGFPVQLFRNRPDVMAAEFGLVNAFELTNVAKSNFYPSLNISLNAGFQSVEIEKLLDLNSLFATTVASLTQPIFNKRRIRTQYEVAQAQEQQAFLNFKQSLLNAGREVSDALYSYSAAEEKIEILQKEYEAYNKAAVYSEELLNNGMINYLEVLTARENALFSQLDVINSRFNKLNAVVELYRALGGGWQ